jgi:hypothetical protein
MMTDRCTGYEYLGSCVGARCSEAERLYQHAARAYTEGRTNDYLRLYEVYNSHVKACVVNAAGPSGSGYPGDDLSSSDRRSSCRSSP